MAYTLQLKYIYIKRFHRQKNPVICFFQKTSKYTNTEGMKIKRWKKLSQVNNQTKATLFILEKMEELQDKNPH